MPKHKLSDALKMKGRSDERRLAEMSDEEKTKNALSDIDAPPLTEEELAEMKPVNDICTESLQKLKWEKQTHMNGKKKIL